MTRVLEQLPLTRSHGRAGERLLLASTFLGTGLVLLLVVSLFVAGLGHLRGQATARVGAPGVVDDANRAGDDLAANILSPVSVMPSPLATPMPVAGTPTPNNPGDSISRATTPRPTSTTPPAPTMEPEPMVLEYGLSERREVALTFDAGADRGYGSEILDLLAEEGVKASFGMTGMYAEANPDLVRRMVAEGHMLFNHTWSHRSFTGTSSRSAPLTRSERMEELRTTEDLVRDLTGHEMRPYFRPPYGDYDESVLADLADAGYGVTVHWSCDSRDSLGATAAEILTRCVEGVQPGRIILLHVGAQSAAYETLPWMIASLREQGFAFVTVEEMLQP